MSISDRLRGGRLRRPCGPAGIEAGETQLRLAQWRVRGRLRTWQAAEVTWGDTTSGTRAAARKLRAAARAAGIAGGPAVCVVCSPRVDVLPLSVRAAVADSFDAQVARQALDQLNCAAEDLVLDYARLPVEMTRETQSGVAVLVFALPRALAVAIVTGAEQAGFAIERLMTPACALAAVLSRGGVRERHLIVFPAEEATSVSIVEDGHVLLERILPWSLRGVVQHMRGELDLEEERCRRLLTQESAESAAPGAGGGLGSLESALREILGGQLQDLAREVVGCVGYSDSFLRRGRIAAIVPAGPMAGNALLREYLARASDLPFHELEGLGELPRRGECPQDFAYTPAASCALWPREEAA